MDAASTPKSGRTAVLLAAGGGLSFALFWSLGFVVALHGIRNGLAPADIVFHRLCWPGLLFSLTAMGNRFADLGDLGVMRGALLAVLGGPLMLILSYTGFVYTVLGHGAVIQPAAATLMGLAFAGLWLAERMNLVRGLGALAIIAGLMLLGAEAVTTIGRHGVLGDLCFVAAGTSWAAFGTLLRHWKVESRRATAIVSVFALLVYAPLHAALFGFTRMAAAGWFENLMQIVVQGVLAGPVSIYLFAYTARVLGAGRASAFSTFVPVFTLLIGFVALGETPTGVQILGLIVTLSGVRAVMAK